MQKCSDGSLENTCPRSPTHNSISWMTIQPSWLIRYFLSRVFTFDVCKLILKCERAKSKVSVCVGWLCRIIHASEKNRVTTIIKNSGDGSINLTPRPRPLAPPSRAPPLLLQSTYLFHPLIRMSYCCYFGRNSITPTFSCLINAKNLSCVRQSESVINLFLEVLFLLQKIYIMISSILLLIWSLIYSLYTFTLWSVGVKGRLFQEDLISWVLTFE